MRCVGPSVTDRLKKSGWGKWGREGKKRRAGRDLLPVRYWCSCVHVQHSMYYWDLLFQHHVFSSLSHTKGKKKKKKRIFPRIAKMEDVSTASHFCRRRKNRAVTGYLTRVSIQKPKSSSLPQSSHRSSPHTSRAAATLFRSFLPQSVIHGAPVVHASQSPMLATMALTIDSVNAAPSLFTTIIELHLPATHRRNHLRMLARFRIRKMVAVAPTINAYQKKPTHHPLLSTSDPCAKNMRAFLVRLSLVIA